MKQSIALYISYDGMTDPIGSAQSIPYLERLALNYKVHLISFEKPNATENKAVIEERLKESNIVWHPLDYTKTPPVLSTVKDIRTLYKKVGDLICKYDVWLIHCRSYIGAFAGLKFKKSHNIPWIFDMRGFWVDERIDGGMWNKRNLIYYLIYKYFKVKERQFLIDADHVFTVTQKAKVIIQDWGFATADRITVVPCCANFNHFDGSSVDGNWVQTKKEELGISSGKSVLLYLGSFETYYNLKEMLQFFHALWKKNKDWVFLFVTRDNKNKIFETAKSLGIHSSLIKIASATRSEVPSYIQICDLSVVFVYQLPSKEGSSAVKIAEILAMGKPMVVNDIGDNKMIFKKYKFGTVVDLNHKDWLNNALEGIKIIDKSKIREGAMAIFSLERGVEKYMRVYEKIRNT